MALRFNHLVGALAFCVAGTTQASSILYESATNGGGTSNGGNAIENVQFLGSEFTLTSATLITNVIGEVQTFSGPNLFFMTLLKLSGPGLPNNLIGDPFGGTNPLYTTTFTAAPDFSSKEVSFPLSLSVSAGTYAIVFGSGMFGSPVTAIGSMPGSPQTGNIVQPGANLFIWYDSTSTLQDFSKATWTKSINLGERFVVEGTTTPEPSSAILIGIGFVMLALCQLKKSGRISRV